MKRLTSKDYQKKHDDLLNNYNALDLKVTSRLIELVKIYPNACSTLSEYILIHSNLNEVSLLMRLKYMESIEQWAEEQHPHKQLKNDF